MQRISLTIQDAVTASGIARTRLYELIGEGRLDARKVGKRTLIMADSLSQYVESLPSAKIGAANQKVAA